ncbi:MAG TPA: Fe-S cluster assembly protein SufD [Acidimicrobiia bacterium]|nr:Fe-S cluster assembly protein SufD [Acidimicrobiia bacterium]
MLPLNEQTFDRVAASLPAWARPSAEAGFSAFTSLPMPDPRQEEWRYVEVGVDLTARLLPTAAGEPLPPDGSLASVLGELAGHAVNIDGHTASVRAADGVCLSSLAGAVAADGEAVRRAFRSGPAAGLDRFSAAHHAFATDGVFLHVARGQRTPGPVLVEFQATAAGSLALPRLTVLAEEGAEGSVVLHYRSPDGVELVAVPQVELVAAENARLMLTIVQEWGEGTRAFGHQTMVTGRDSSVTFSEAGLGGSSARLHLRIGLDGAGSEARVLGLYFGHRQQTLDYRYYVDHRAQHTTSSMYLKGAVGDTARSVFTGLIRIEPEGQHSDAMQTNRNLVLSEGAQAHSVPNLEILANEVRCGHGSSVGPIDPEQRYYLMSRGLDEARADRLQVKGYFEDVLARFPHGELEPSLRQALMARYDGLESMEG